MVKWFDIVKFLRTVSRIHLTQDEQDHLLYYVKKDVLWENIAILAELEGVAGFVYYHMQELDLLGFIPKPAQSLLEAAYNLTKKQTVTIIAETNTLSAILVESCLPVLALQGLSVINMYPDPGLRLLGDIDLMVKPYHKNLLKKKLWQAGYRPVYATYPDIFHKDDILVDIHTHILNLDRIYSRRHLFPEDLTPGWERAIPLFKGLNGLFCADPLDNFVFLAAHSLKHSYSRLIWLVDLHECLLKFVDNSGSWEDIVKRTQFWQQEKVVLYALILVETIFGLKVPCQIKSLLGIDRLNIFEKHLLRLKLRGFNSREFGYILWLCNIRGTWNKLKFLKENVFPKKEVMAQIIYDISQTGKRAGYIGRAAKIINLIAENLCQAFIFSFRKG